MVGYTIVLGSEGDGVLISVGSLLCLVLPFKRRQPQETRLYVGGPHRGWHHVHVISRNTSTLNDARRRFFHVADSRMYLAASLLPRPIPCYYFSHHRCHIADLLYHDNNLLTL